MTDNTGDFAPPEQCGNCGSTDLIDAMGAFGTSLRPIGWRLYELDAIVLTVCQTCGYRIEHPVTITLEDDNYGIPPPTADMN